MATLKQMVGRALDSMKAETYKEIEGTDLFCVFNNNRVSLLVVDNEEHFKGYENKDETNLGLEKDETVPFAKESYDALLNKGDNRYMIQVYGDEFAKFLDMVWKASKDGHIVFKTSCICSEHTEPFEVIFKTDATDFDKHAIYGLEFIYPFKSIIRKCEDVILKWGYGNYVGKETPFPLCIEMNLEGEAIKLFVAPRVDE